MGYERVSSVPKKHVCSLPSHEQILRSSAEWTKKDVVSCDECGKFFWLDFAYVGNKWKWHWWAVEWFNWRIRKRIRNGE